MRIICDHCSQPIAGTVKRVAGNFNLHLVCIAELGKEAKRESTAVSWRGHESSASALMEAKEILPNALPER